MSKKNYKQKYTPLLLKAAEEWIKENGLIEFGGAPLLEYAKAMGIHPTSHYNWLNTHKEYADLVERCVEYHRQCNVRKVANAMLDAAVGGYRENIVEDVEYKPNPNNPDKPMIARKRTHKEKKWYQPNTASGCFMLTNLAPDKFQNRQRSEVNVKSTEVRELSVEEAQDLIRKLNEEN